MPTKILSVVERAYHGTLEEQDDTILWLSHMLKNSGACISVLLRANAVNYLVRGQDASGLVIGGIPLSHPPKLDADVQRMIGAGISVYAVYEDLVRQLGAIGAVGAWSFGITTIILLALKTTVGLRVTSEEEEIGLDLSEHGETA